jgi:hypothetical protein
MASRTSIAVIIAITGVLCLLQFLPGTAHAGKVDPTVDPDNDGCTTDEELGSNQLLGGRRDLNNHFDFFDTPPRDNTISVVDISRIVAHFGQSASAGGDLWSRIRPRTIGWYRSVGPWAT